MISSIDNDYRFIDMFCYNVGNILYNSQQFDRALRYYQIASIYRPDDTDYLYFIGACYRGLEQYEDAIKYFQKVLEINPNDSGAYQQLDLCKSKLGI